MLLTGYMALYKVTMMAMVAMMVVMMAIVTMITMMMMMTIIGCVSSGTLRKCKSQLDSLSLPTNLQKESSFSFPHLMRIMINSFNKTMIQYHNANYGWMLQFHNWFYLGITMISNQMKTQMSRSPLVSQCSSLVLLCSALASLPAQG